MVQWLRLHSFNAGVPIWSPVRELMEKAMAPYSSTLAWKIPWMEEPGGLQSMGSLRVGHDWATSLSLFTFMHWRRKWQPTPVFLPGESRGRRAWWADIYGVTQSRAWLKWLSSSSRDLRSCMLPSYRCDWVACAWESPEEHWKALNVDIKTTTNRRLIGTFSLN